MSTLPILAPSDIVPAHPSPRNPGKAKHVTLIRPAMVSSTGTWSSPITPPLGIAYLAAMLEENGTKVAVIDAIAEGVEQFIESDGYVFQGLTTEQTVARIDGETDMIGISIMFTQDWPCLLELIRAIRKRFPETMIVAGGEHITALPEFSLENCPELDVCALGEGEETIVDLVNHVDSGGSLHDVAGIAFREGGKVVRTVVRKRIRDVDALPIPSWDLFPMDVYMDSRNAHGVYLGKSIGILATRGCPYKCTFCSNPVMYGNLWMARSPSLVLDEIELYIKKYGIRNVDFYDLTFILKKSWIIEFCRLIEERGLQFTWQLPTGTRSEVIDDEVSAALYRTGCRNITYAPESGSPDTLERIKKRVHLPKLVDSIRSALRQKINVKCNIVIGFPHETRQHVLQTIVFCWKLAVIGVQDVGMFIFSPYAGSQLFDELRKDGTIGPLNDDYFRSLVAFMDPLAPSLYCKHINGRELALWRFFGMSSFFLLSYMIRPWRLVRMIRNVIRNESVTVLEQRLGAILRRHAVRAPATSEARTPAAV
ncbi:MAG: cobalamin-dependent protein [Planctomycetota bacterium]